MMPMSDKIGYADWGCKPVFEYISLDGKTKLNCIFFDLKNTPMNKKIKFNYY